ncbi:uncharacterized protein DSM5745_02634 [Aspergillus mulundensis]|uniref:Uncharacterized protein n=1 Tax=Aspergillus mulundensis TaxID=1810919 RepID=A0A3D8SX68_9EURO|nr:hypothetical protein DSM5745_02634 [Aspergillus mulundensis]RDW90859.1 hypothetical protein DSM5745_02634 [Aspergillus mulundensis]
MSVAIDFVRAWPNNPISTTDARDRTVKCRNGHLENMTIDKLATADGVLVWPGVYSKKADANTIKPEDIQQEEPKAVQQSEVTQVWFNLIMLIRSSGNRRLLSKVTAAADQQVLTELYASLQEVRNDRDSLRVQLHNTRQLLAVHTAMMTPE